MSEIEQKEKYPFAVVILIYGLLGGLVGGGFYALYLFITSFYIGPTSIIVRPLPKLFVVLMGAIFGFIPSIFAGIWLAVIKFTVTKKSDYFKVAMIGYFSTLFYYVTGTIIANVLDNVPINEIFELHIFKSNFLYLGFLGAFSAMSVGWIVLPKRLNYTKK